MTSNGGKNSPFSSLWHGALALLGSVALVWIAAKLIESIWTTLVVIGAVIIVATAVVIVVSRWMRRRRW